MTIVSLAYTLGCYLCGFNKNYKREVKYYSIMIRWLVYVYFFLDVHIFWQVLMKN